MEQTELKIKHMENGVTKQHTIILKKEIKKLKRKDIFNRLLREGLFTRLLKDGLAYIVNDKRHDHLAIVNDNVKLMFNDNESVVYILITDESLSDCRHCTSETVEGIKAMTIS